MYTWYRENTIYKMMYRENTMYKMYRENTIIKMMYWRIQYTR